MPWRDVPGFYARILCKMRLTTGIVSMLFKATIDDPGRFKDSRGGTPRVYAARLSIG
jgi:hypothetical protein